MLHSLFAGKPAECDMTCGGLHPERYYLECPVCGKLVAKPPDVKKLKNTINVLQERLAREKARSNFLKLEMDHTAPVLNGDLTIIVWDGGRKLYAHSFILSDRSPVFRKMFQTAMQEKERGEIEIIDATFPVMLAVVKHCYTSTVIFTDEVTADLVFKIAHKYGLDNLQLLCEREMKDTVNDGNVAKRLKLSRTYDLDDLGEVTLKHFEKNFKTVVSSVLEELDTERSG